FVL
ncbi:ankyrin repeat domain-containing protein 6, partial [Caerostris darwini]